MDTLHLKNWNHTPSSPTWICWRLFPITVMKSLSASASLTMKNSERKMYSRHPLSIRAYCWLRNNTSKAYWEREQWGYFTKFSISTIVLPNLMCPHTACTVLLLIVKELNKYEQGQLTLASPLPAVWGTMISWMRPWGERRKSRLPRVKIVPRLFRLLVKKLLARVSSTPIRSSRVTPSSYWWNTQVVSDKRSW